MPHQNGETDRVRAHTGEEVLEKIDTRTWEEVRDGAKMSDAEIERRITELEQEWDVERVLEANAAGLGLAGLALGAFHSRRWLVIPALIFPFLLQHAVQGWCPPLAVFRRMGIRTRREIDQEKNALKALRGDFKEVKGWTARRRASRALDAVNR
ncbi:MAG TPA: hypothetical protein VF889_04995 [Bacteroidota bacterium]